jgi:ADP-ribose pyrophosphatase YjhB (NUDIX family)
VATAIIPKSEIRRNENIREGYGEVPSISRDGVKGWGLPGGLFTSSELVARKCAKQLDKNIRRNMTHINQLLSAA